MISFWDVVGRSESGPLLREEEFDLQVGRVAHHMVEKYGIRYDPLLVVPAYDDLADRVYQAGLDLFLELGIYCRDTGRLMKFTRDEVEWALKHAPTTVTYGQGRDAAVMTYRTIEDPKPPFCLMTPVGTTVAEERFVPMVQSYVQEPLAPDLLQRFSARRSTADPSSQAHLRR